MFERREHKMSVSAGLSLTCRHKPRIRASGRIRNVTRDEGFEFVLLNVDAVLVRIRVVCRTENFLNRFLQRRRTNKVFWCAERRKVTIIWQRSHQNLGLLERFRRQGNCAQRIGVSSAGGRSQKMCRRAKRLTIPDNNRRIKRLVELVPKQQFNRLIFCETEHTRKFAINLVRIFIVGLLRDTVLQRIGRVREHRRSTFAGLVKRRSLAFIFEGQWAEAVKRKNLEERTLRIALPLIKPFVPNWRNVWGRFLKNLPKNF